MSARRKRRHEDGVDDALSENPEAIGEAEPILERNDFVHIHIHGCRAARSADH